MTVRFDLDAGVLDHTNDHHVEADGDKQLHCFPGTQQRARHIGVFGRLMAVALEQIGNRQAMIDAVRNQIVHVVELAERASDNVRSIAAARHDVEETKALLDATQDQLKDATTSMRAFADHRRQVEDLERRVARADAVALDVRASVEVIAAQRAYVDQVLERSGTLAFQMKHAEALTEALRNECAIVTQVRAAVGAVRDEGKI